MIKVFCDKCGKDCDLNAYDITVSVIHNPCPHHARDRGKLKITDDDTFMRMVLCSDCYESLNLPNLYDIYAIGVKKQHG